jgi:hypothetical protein
MARKPFKKDLTPIGRKGKVTTHTGKGATEQRTRPRERESLTGGSPFERAGNAYPKPMPAPPPMQPTPMGPPAQPADLAPLPSAMMPPKIV